MRVGDVLAKRFELQAEAGEGAMGTIYRAIDRTTNAQVAVKVLLGKGQERFEREAAVLSFVEHPAVVRFVASGRTDAGAPYLAMEWLEGIDLEARLAQGPMSVAETLALGIRLAEGVGAVHDAGIVHRDLKPSNVMLVGGRADACKLLDFGIARYADPRSLTQAGVVVGTPEFMSPEQARGDKNIGPAADVFSLGCILYECLTGKPAFAGEQVFAVLTKVLFEEVAPATEISAAPRELSELVQRMLSKDPEARPRDGKAVAAALMAFDPNRKASIRMKALPKALGQGELRLVSVIATRDGGVDVSGLGDSLRLERLVDGGRVAVMIGDAIATDVAQRAVRAALSLSNGGAAVVATGRALLAGQLPMGEVIDRAAALLAMETANSPGVRLDVTTASLCGGRFALAEREGSLYATREHGKDQPARKLLGREPPFVGRERELDELMTTLAKCIDDRRAQSLLVTAPSGGGKSRLLSEWLRRVRNDSAGVEIWTARGDPMGAGSAFSLAGQMIRGAAGIELGETASLAQAKMLARVSRNLTTEAPRIAQFLGEISGSPFPTPEGSPLAHARQDGQRMCDHLMSAWLDLVEAELRVQPLMLVLEDVQWGDAATERLCAAALRVCHDRPLLLLALGRPEARASFFAGRAFSELQLAPLSRSVCEAFARSVIEREAIAARIAEHSQGNPLLLEELVRAELEGRGGKTPLGVAAILQARLATLAEPARRTLRAASICGTTFWESAVSALLGGVDAAETRQWLDHLIDHDIIERHTHGRFTSETEYAFRNALVQQAAYGTLVEEDLIVGHKLAALWLEQRGERDTVVVAEHFEKGQQRADAILWWKRAAEDAAFGSELEQAITLAERAITLGAEGETLGELRLLQSSVHLWRGEKSEQFVRSKQALAALPSTSPAFFDALSNLCQAATYLADNATVMQTYERLVGSDSRAVQVARGTAAASMSNHLRQIGLQKKADALLDIAETTLALHPNNRVVQAHVLKARAGWSRFKGDAGSVLADERAQQEVWRQLGDTKMHLAAGGRVGDALMHLGRYAEAEHVLRWVVGEADRLGIVFLETVARHNLGFVLSKMGKQEEARREEEYAIATFERRGDRYWVRCARSYLADILRRQGELVLAAEVARAVIAGGETDPLGAEASTTLAEVLMAAGSPKEALEACAPALRVLESTGLEEAEARLRLVHAQALVATRQLDAAKEVARRACARLTEKAEKLAEASERKSFLENVEEHVRTFELARQLGV